MRDKMGTDLNRTQGFSNLAAWLTEIRSSKVIPVLTGSNVVRQWNMSILKMKLWKQSES